MAGRPCPAISSSVNCCCTWRVSSSVSAWRSASSRSASCSDWVSEASSGIESSGNPSASARAMAAWSMPPRAATAATPAWLS